MTYVIALKCRDLNGRVAESDISNIVRAGIMVFVSTLRNDTIGPDMATGTDVRNEPDTTTGPDVTNEPGTTDPVPTEDPTTNSQGISDNPGILIAIIYGAVGIAAIIGVIIVMAVINQVRAPKIARPKWRLRVQNPLMRFAPYQNQQFRCNNLNEVRIV